MRVGRGEQERQYVSAALLDRLRSRRGLGVVADRCVRLEEKSQLWWLVAIAWTIRGRVVVIAAVCAVRSCAAHASASTVT
jgi:hypothetical protein